MDGTKVLLILTLAVVVIVVAWRARAAMQGRLRTLSTEDKARYAQSWSSIQARFLAEPAPALQEADQLAISILHDRGARMGDGWRPAEMHLARELARTNGGDPATTEGLRKAMLQYEIIVDDAVGAPMRKSLDAQRNEVV